MKNLNCLVVGDDDIPMLMISGGHGDIETSCIILPLEDARELLAELPALIDAAERGRV